MTEESTDNAAEEPEDLNQKWVVPDDDERSVYRFVLAAARRARQLQGGQRTAIKTTLRKPTKIAMEEIRSGAVRVEVVPEGQPLPPEDAFGFVPGRIDIERMLARESSIGDDAWGPGGRGPVPPPATRTWPAKK